MTNRITLDRMLTTRTFPGASDEGLHGERGFLSPDLPYESITICNCEYQNKTKGKIWKLMNKPLQIEIYTCEENELN